MRQLCYVTPLLAGAASTLGILVAPTAVADCNTSGYATVCSQGEVRGGSGPAPVTAYDPYQCSDPYLCYYDTYDPLIVIDPDWGNRPGGGGGGRPGGGGGIGPR